MGPALATRTARLAVAELYVGSGSRGGYRKHASSQSSNRRTGPVPVPSVLLSRFLRRGRTNYTPGVRKAVLGVLDFWMGMGVDGVRLDAVPYLFERDGTDCENLPETHAFLKEMRRHIEAKFPNRMFLAEANQWPEDSVAYFGDGDECHMNFHFPLMPRIFMGLQQEQSFPILDILEQTPAIPETCQWAIFLRNHDELTLEMVTDEERDYMWRVYANDPTARINLGIRRRLAPLLGNDRKRIELMSGLLYSLPGTPVIYYGDEIGMGDNIYPATATACARRCGGTPTATPASRGRPAASVSVLSSSTPSITTNRERENQQKTRTRSSVDEAGDLAPQAVQAFGRGSIECLHPREPQGLAFVAALAGREALVFANLSRFAQHVALGPLHSPDRRSSSSSARRALVIGDSPYR